jgi:membrane-bound lytic murein transglycosylase D
MLFLYRPLARILLLCALLAFSGCTVSKNIGWLDIVEPAPEPDIAGVQDPDLVPVELESETRLDQELEALASTGSWDDSQQTQIDPALATDFAEPSVEYDFPITINRQVELYLELFQGKQRKYFSSWLSRSGRYLPMMHAELEAAGLPLDLAYLSMIESGFNQRAYSRSRAVGLWQFMAGTGREYGLAITRYVDERRDAEKSTKAAVTYLKHLYEEFDDWYLAVAAYNGGPGTMRSAIRRSKSKDFWKIAEKRYLKLETKRYVPKLIAAILIAKEPEKYGFADVSYDPPLSWETFPVGPGLSLDAVALLTDSNGKEIKMLNQELKTGKTPLDQEKYVLKIPTGTREVAERNLPRLHSVVTTEYKTHIVREKESLAQICRRYNINTTTLLKVNNLKSNKLVVDSRLRIPYRTIHYRILPEGMDGVIAAKNDLVLHTIRRGETISKISKQYQVPAELIVAWNGLPSVHRITAGQQLALYLNNGAELPSANSAETARTSGTASQLMVLSNTKKFAPAPQRSAEVYTWYLVKSGDSLWTISRRFNTSPADIRKWNNLKSNLIHPGSRLKVKDV